MFESNFIQLSSEQVIGYLGDLVLDSSLHPPIIFNGVCSSTALTKNGFLFVAIPGLKTDGHQYIEVARAEGAAGCVISDRNIFDKLSTSGINVILVSNTRRAISRLAYHFTDQAAEKLSIIGVTGTNGKTTTHWMIDSLLKLAGKRTARLGTIGMQILDATYDSNLTTPDPILLHTFFAECVRNKVEFVTMEVSSHALEQLRVEDVKFSAAVFTNLSRDHLDYHPDMTAYAMSKCHLFDLVKEKNGIKNVVINHDNEWSQFVIDYSLKNDCQNTGFSKNNSRAALQYSAVQASALGTKFILTDYLHDGVTTEVQSDFIGNYNLENLLAAIGTVMTFGFEVKNITSLVKKIPHVPGRLERCKTPEHVSVFVDYAHTPDALQSALSALRPLCAGKLWVIFGCGGDRDRGKRPLMLSAARAIADCVMVTSDNPRTEQPERIIEDILGNNEVSLINSSDKKEILIQVDRREAIIEVLSKAESDDIVLVAGKGHEDYQIIGTQKNYFSDQKIVQEFYSNEL